MLNPANIPLLQVIKAAVALPVLYNKLVPLGDLRCFDAGFCNPFPLDGALRHRNSHVLVLLAKGQNYVSPPKTWWEKDFFLDVSPMETVSWFNCLKDHVPMQSVARFGAWESQLPDADACIATVSPPGNNQSDQPKR